MGEINLKVNLSYGDKYMGDSDEEREGLYMQFIFWGILIPCIAAFGFVGNTLTIIVLWRREMVSTTIYYMRALVVTDTGILLTALVVLTPFSIAAVNPRFSYYKEVVYPQIFTPINYIIMAIQMCNVWITVSVSVERYIVICHPFRSGRLVTKKLSLIVIGSVCVLSVLYNIPRLFATASRICDAGEECYVLYSTDFGKSVFFQYGYQGWMYVIVIYTIPLTSLIVLNCLIIVELMHMQERRRGTNIQDDNEANMTLVLVLIVIVFVLCQTLGFVSQFDIFAFPVFLKLLAISNTLIVFNSSVNFLIYTAVGRRFRKVLLNKVFFPCLKREAFHFSASTHVSVGYELTRVSEAA